MRFLVGLLVVVAIAAFATRPDAQALDDMIVGELQVEASNFSVGDGDTLVSGIAKIGCSLSPEDCARLIRAAMEIEVEDLYVARRGRVRLGDDPTMTCIGAFTQWTCRPAG